MLILANLKKKQFANYELKFIKKNKCLQHKKFNIDLQHFNLYFALKSEFLK